jgi:ABC-type transporter Mla subunit MlaD
VRRGLVTALLLAVIAGGVVALVATGGSSGRTYKIELDNAFGLVTGADFKVAGVKAGTIKSIDLNQRNLHAVVTVQVTQPGFGSFHADAFCLSRPQSLICEYFITCDPGTRGAVLPSGSTIPVTRTQSTIPADLLQNIMRVPYRQRFTLIVGELGAAAAGRSGDLQAALARAVPALTQTDNLLSLLGNDSQTLQQLTASSNQVITALANNSQQIKRFIVEANRAASATATQQVNLASSLQKLPTFLEQLRPAMVRLGAATQANTPVLANLNASASQLHTLFTTLPAFSRASIPAFRALGSASVTGDAAVNAARPTIAALNQFAKPTPDLAQNLAIVTEHIDNRKYATEANSRSPGGKGYTGLESLLQFAFNLAAATNTYGPFGHQLAVDAFVSAMCTPYASAGTVYTNTKTFGPAARSCYAWLGPNQPGVNTTDPSNPTACVPDPGGAPPGQTAPATTAAACKTAPARVPASRPRGQKPSTQPVTSPTGATPTTGTGSGSGSPGSTGGKGGLAGIIGGLLGTTGAGGTVSKVGGILSGLLGGGGSGSTTGTTGAGGLLGGLGRLLSGGGTASAHTGGGLLGAAAAHTAVAKQLLKFLIAP